MSFRNHLTEKSHRKNPTRNCTVVPDKTNKMESIVHKSQSKSRYSNKTEIIVYIFEIYCGNNILYCSSMCSSSWKPMNTINVGQISNMQSSLVQILITTRKYSHTKIVIHLFTYKIVNFCHFLLENMKVVEIAFKPIACTKCNVRFTSTKNVSRHMKSTHSNQSKRLQCYLCKKVYKTKSNHDVHYRKKHLAEHLLYVQPEVVDVKGD